MHSRVRRFVKRGWPSSVREEELQPYSRRKEELSFLDGCLLTGGGTQTRLGSVGGIMAGTQRSFA